ncbi:MAG TPA: carboxypeptidase-like regulatory domain-containing protein [Terracidiphilus sp.]|nr:carboxypeptidase-like regulatory domain-containing protein [Terracidiphilus sp.]
MDLKRRSRTGPLAAAVLLACAASPLFAQSRVRVIRPEGLGSLSGKLADLHAVPLAGATVILRNQATGTEVRATTGRNGAYRFTGLAPGEYTVVAESAKLGRGSLGGIEVDAGAEARVETAMRFEPPAAGEPKTVASMEAVPAEIGPTAPAPSPPPSQPQRVIAVRPAKISPPVLSVTPDASVAAQPIRGLPLMAMAAPPAPPSAGAGEIGRIGAPAAGSEASELAVAGLDLKMQLSQLPPPRILAAAQQPDPVAATVTTTVSGSELQTLPVSGRRWQDFVLDTPSASTQSGGEGGTAMRGSVTEPAGMAVDGVSTRLAFGNTGGSRPGASASDGPNRMAQAWGGRGAMVSEAAIRQVQTVAGNVEARVSRGAGGRVEVTTESGSNQLHGQGILFDRQNTWAARNPFTQWVKETAPATNSTTPVFTPEAYTPPDHEVSLGLGVGGRIRRDKLYWFGALDANHRNDPGIAMVKHPDQFFAQPSNDEMQALSARLGMSSVNPVAEGLGAYSKMLETLAGLLGPAPRTSAEWVGFGRIDWKTTERQTFTLEGTGASWNAPGGGMRAVSEPYGSHSFGSSQAAQEWLLARWEAFLTPNLLAVTQGSAGRAVMTARPETPSAFEQTLEQSAWGQLPQIVVDSRYGFTIGNPARFGPGNYPAEQSFRAQQMVDWAHNSMLVKAGFNVGHNADSTNLLRNETGTYHYATVYDFVSDALAFDAFGLAGVENASSPHNCDQRGKVWRDSAGGLRGLGNLPCYSYYSQMMGPTYWHLSTNDWAGYATAQWQPKKLMVVAVGLRWDREQMPPPIAWLTNPDLPLAEKLPELGNQWSPRISMAVGNGDSRLPVLRMGYGIYYGRTQNATLESVLTQSGSMRGDLNFFIRPTDGLNSFSARSGAPLFPYVLEGEPMSVVKPDVVEFAPGFRNPEVHQAVASLEEKLPAHLHLAESALVSLGRRLPVAVDTNFDPAMNPKTITYAVVDGTGKGPIKTPQITVPFYATWPSPTGATGRLNPGYQQISQLENRANSTYEAAVVRVSRYGRGISFSAHYTYAHAMDWNPDESTYLGGSGVLDPADFGAEYGTSSLDVRHSGGTTLTLEAPWKLHGEMGRVADGWRLSGVGYFRSGLPYTMRTSGSLAKEFTSGGDEIVALGPGMNGSGGDNRVYGVGRNIYRYPWTWKADVRVGKRFDLGHLRQLELLAESFNLFNHQNVTRVETTGYYVDPGSRSGGLPTLNFLTGLKTNTTAFGQPLNINATNYFRERQIQIGLRMKF